MNDLKQQWTTNTNVTPTANTSASPLPPDNQNIPSTTIIEDPSSTPVESIVLPQNSPSSDKSIVAAAGNNRRGVGAAMAVIFGLVFLIVTTLGSVYYIKQTKLRSAKAWDCGKYHFLVSKEGFVSAKNEAETFHKPQKIRVLINGEQVGIFEAPSLQSGSSATIVSVPVPNTGIFNWEVSGVENCSNSGAYN